MTNGGGQVLDILHGVARKHGLLQSTLIEQYRFRS